MVKTHLKYALHAYTAAHPPTPQNLGGNVQCALQTQTTRHSSAKGGPPTGTAPDPTASKPGPPLWPQHLSRQNCSPPAILEDQHVHGMRGTPGGHRWAQNQSQLPGRLPSTHRGGARAPHTRGGGPAGPSRGPRTTDTPPMDAGLRWWLGARAGLLCPRWLGLPRLQLCAS